MLQGAPYYSSPVYGQSHFKKFWLKKVETEDGGSSPDAGVSTGGVPLKKKPSYVVNCSPSELASGSISTAADDRKPRSSRESSMSSEPDCTLLSGARAGVTSEYKDCDNGLKTEISSDGSFSGEDVVNRRSSLKPLASNSPQEETPSCNQMRTCADCKTIKTPLWRNGPRGPKSLCNACGIRYKKLGKRPASNGAAMYESPSSPPTPPISPTANNKQIAKLNRRKKEEDGKALAHPRKKIRTSGMDSFGAARSDGQSSGGAIGLSDLQSLPQSERESPRVVDNLDQEGRRRWRTVEEGRKGVVGYSNVRAMAKDEEEGAVLLMALKCGVVS